MGTDIFEITINLIKIIVIFFLMVQMVPVLVWIERRGSAFIQNRFGPNRVGPLGLTQLLADLVKFLFKEDFMGKDVKKSFFYCAPILSLLPAALALGAVPLSAPVEITAFEWLGHTWGPYIFYFQSFVMSVGVVFVLGVSSLAVYPLLLAGWSSGSKFSLYGALRASAQTISYALALSLCVVGVLLLFNTFDFIEIAKAQAGPMQFHFFGKEVTWLMLPNWGIFYQPLGAILLFIALFAESNRLPFDLPEAEAELVAGYHTEYGGIKIIMFYMGEYGHMLLASVLMVTFYFGSYTLWPFLTPDTLRALLASFSPTYVSLISSLVLHLVFMAKTVIFLWIFIWVRWTLPRFRYDQLMDLGWKTLLPWALFNVVITGVWIFLMRTNWS